MSALLDLRCVRELATLEVGPGDTLLPHLLETFAEDTRITLEQMRASVRRCDPRLLARDAHRLRGGSSSIGAVQLAGELAEIERSARAGHALDVEARITRALDLLYATCDAIIIYCPSFRNRAGGAP